MINVKFSTLLQQQTFEIKQNEGIKMPETYMEYN